MDLDLFSNLLRDDPSPSSGSLLPNSTDRILTYNSTVSGQNIFDHASGTRASTTAAQDPVQTGRVISKIENIFESITDCILDQKKELVISLRSRPKCKSSDSEDSTSDANSKSEIKKITFPSKSQQEAWKFSESKMTHRSRQLI
jgi:meiotic recombination protein SPO11